MAKIRVAVLFGGKSAEHEVSLMSARNVADALDKNTYEVTLIGINKSGVWLPPTQSESYLRLATGDQPTSESTALMPGSEGRLGKETIDVVFPVLHGTFGEDGTVQGLLELADVAYVGAGVLGSAVGMDKDVMKRLLRDAGIPVGKFIALRRGASISYSDAVSQLGSPLFIKPANAGSSVGVSKVRDKNEFSDALDHAFQFDDKVLLEQFIDGKEVECAVLGNDTPEASVVGELDVHHEFYSYEAKYLDPDGMTPRIPADLSPEVTQRVREISVAAFKALECSGMGRVDSFVTKDGAVYLNEINTIPGFTNISMYPKLWEASGLSYAKLIDRLIELALERHARKKRILTDR